MVEQVAGCLQLSDWERSPMPVAPGSERAGGFVFKRIRWQGGPLLWPGEMLQVVATLKAKRVFAVTLNIFPSALHRR
jgi:hypothetical protein